MAYMSESMSPTPGGRNTPSASRSSALSRGFARSTESIARYRSILGSACGRDADSFRRMMAETATSARPTTRTAGRCSMTTAGSDRTSVSPEWNENCTFRNLCVQTRTSQDAFESGNQSSHAAGERAGE